MWDDDGGGGIYQNRPHDQCCSTARECDDESDWWEGSAANSAIKIDVSKDKRLVCRHAIDEDNDEPLMSAEVEAAALLQRRLVAAAAAVVAVLQASY